MEVDVILEGFLNAEQSHGVRHMRFVGDGDSSVFPTLRQSVPVWGRDIQKIECANHACKCYRSSLEKLVADNPSYKGKGGLTKKMRKRLTCAARCAIKMRSKNPDTKNAAKLLERDLWNGPLHCFGNHNKCSTDFCSTDCQIQQAGPSTNCCSSTRDPSEDHDKTSNEMPSGTDSSNDIQGMCISPYIYNVCVCVCLCVCVCVHVCV